MATKTKKKKSTKTKKLKLYVWRGVLSDYTDGIAFALATSPDHARRLISEKISPRVVEEQLSGDPEVHTKARGFAIWGGG